MPLHDKNSDGDRAKGEKAAAVEQNVDCGWLATNVLHPLANSAAVEPYNAVVRAADNLAGKAVLPHVDLLSTGGKDQVGAVQAVASGLGSLLPYIAAARVAAVPLRGAAGAVDRLAAQGVERGSAAKFLASESTATVAGGALWGGARDPGKGETRLGNAVGSAVGFASFELGGHWSHSLKLPGALTVRGLTGFAGGGAQLLTADLIAGKEVSGSDALKAGLSGAAMNMALPGAQALFKQFNFRSQTNRLELPGTPEKPLPDSELRSGSSLSSVEKVESRPGKVLDPAELETLAQSVRADAAMGRLGNGMGRAFEKVPGPERSQLFSHMLEQAKTQPNLAGVDDLSAALRTLPADSIAQAWREVAGLHKDRFANSLVNAIDNLPPGERLAAVSHAIENFPGAYYLPEHLSAVPAKDYPALAEKVMTMADESFMAKGRMLNDWPADLMQLDAAERARVVEQTLEKVFSLAKRGDETKMQNLWVNLPDKELKTALAAKLSPTDLGKVIFSWAEPDLVEHFGRTHPQAVRRLAAADLTATGADEIRHLQTILRDVKAGETVSQVVLKAAEGKRYFGFYQADNAVPQLLGELLGHAPQAEKEVVLKSFASAVTGSGTPYSSGMQLSRLLIGRLSANPADRALVQDFYVKPVNEALADNSLDYTTRLNKASQTAAIERMLPLEGVHFRIPDMRMARVETGLSTQELGQLRSSVEAALRSPEELNKLIGEGPLGRIFPRIFGRHGEDGGFVGRPQHGGHEFVLDEHTLLVVKRVNEHPDMQKLSAKEQENVLWAAFMHDAGKRPSMSDPGHEWASANLSWGVLRTLGYPAGRIQRIANLVGRHRDVSFDPRVKASERLASQPEHLDDLSTFYRHPPAVTQLRILNESDIRSIDTGSTFWTDAVHKELTKVGESLSSRAVDLNRHAVPILTSELPQRFSLVTMDKPHALLAHVSDHLPGGKFLDQLGVIESPEFSVSTTLVTHNYRRLYNDQPVVALVAGPTENISQAYRANLGTGRSTTWNQHVQLTSQWASPDHYKASSFAGELDKRARSVGINGSEAAANGTELAALRDLHSTVSAFDSLEELIAHHGEHSPYVRAQRQVYEALTVDAGGAPLPHHNEVKLNNPTVVGIGLIRNGQTLHFDGGGPELLARLLGDTPQPTWLSTAAEAPAGALVVPRPVWQAAQERSLPLVVLDP